MFRLYNLRSLHDTSYSQVFGMMAVLERAMQDAEDRNAIFYLTILQTQLQRLQGLVERYIADQVKAIENAQLSNRKRRGVVFFIKHFPVSIADEMCSFTIADNELCLRMLGVCSSSRGSTRRL
jgi:hypothetical protein